MIIGKRVKPLVLLLQLQLEMLRDLQKKHKPERRINPKWLKEERIKNSKHQINLLTILASVKNELKCIVPS
ncbi:hypothetical protein JHK86_000649 [Glycine max]|nr:hypothetical protein JHK86_000649 [Glycine max]